MIYKKNKNPDSKLDNFFKNYVTAFTTVTLHYFNFSFLYNFYTVMYGRPYHQDATWMTSQSRHVMDPHGSGRRRGRPTKTWRSTFKEDLVD